MGFGFVLALAVLHTVVAQEYSTGLRGSWQHNAAQKKRSDWNCNGNITILQQSDVDKISNCSKFIETLTILGPDTVHLPNLVSLQGNLIFNSSSTVVNFTADSLSQIVGNGYSYGLNVQSPPKLKVLSLKGLGNITGQLYIVNASALNTLNVPLLNKVKQRVLIAQTDLLHLNLDTYVGDGYPYGASTYVPAEFFGEFNPLGSKEGIAISSNSALSNLSIPSFFKITSPMTIANNPSLKTFTLPSLVSISGQLVLNGTFESITFPNLTQAMGSVTIRTTYKKFSCNNFGSLPTVCTANAPFGSVNTSGNSYVYVQPVEHGLVITTGMIVGLVVGIVVLVLLCVSCCVCCCMESKAKKRTKLATGSQPVPADVVPVGHFGLPGYELRDASAFGSGYGGLRDGQRRAADDALHVPMHERPSTSVPPPGYADSAIPTTIPAAHHPPPYQPAN